MIKKKNVILFARELLKQSILFCVSKSSYEMSIQCLKEFWDETVNRTLPTRLIKSLSKTVMKMAHHNNTVSYFADDNAPSLSKSLLVLFSLLPVVQISHLNSRILVE